MTSIHGIRIEPARRYPLETLPGRYTRPRPFGECSNPAFTRPRYALAKELGGSMGSLEAMVFVVCATFLVSALAYGRAESASIRLTR